MVLNAYYNLTKPGIIYGNLLAAVAGFFIASRGGFDPVLFLSTMVGLGLVIASACVVNNVHDRYMDAKMQRTKRREMVSGEISVKSALIFGSVLLLLGVGVLLSTNNLALTTALLGWIFYVLVYTLFKSRTVFGTLIGAISGSMPPVVGYLAVTGRVDSATVLLFAILTLWQMPHFYAIAIYRLADYKEAEVPVLPLVHGIYRTKLSMLVYVVLFCVTMPLFWAFGYMALWSVVTMVLFSLTWVWLVVRGFWANNNAKWARQVFLFSLVVLTVFCVIIPVEKILKQIL